MTTAWSLLLMIGTGSFRKVGGRAFFIAIVLTTGVPSVKAAELWDFIRVGKNFAQGPKWESRSGKAVVEVGKSQINIRVSYSDDLKSDAPDKLGYESIKISGTLGPDNSIQATCVFPGTDRNPVKMTGRYLMRDEVQIWDDKRKVITQKEIVFSHPPNSEFFGFLRQDTRDE